MKTLKLHQIVLLAIIAVVGYACSSDSGGGGAGGTTFIPGFNATWPVVGDANREIDLQPDSLNKNVPQGVFPGEELLDGGSTKHPLSGSFNGLDIEFTIDRDSAGNVRYEGKMIPISDTNHQIIRIELTSPEGPMVLEF